MGLYGAEGHPQGLGHFGVGVAEGQQLEHFLFALGEARERVLVLASGDLSPTGEVGTEVRLDP